MARRRLWLELLLGLAVRSVAANLNLYLSDREVKRLLGLEKELYYVRDGIVNKAPLSNIDNTRYAKRQTTSSDCSSTKYWM